MVLSTHDKQILGRIKYDGYYHHNQMVTAAIAINIVTISNIYFLILTYFNFNLSSILHICITIICINFLKMSLFSRKKNFCAKNWYEWKLQINIDIRHPLQEDLFYVVFFNSFWKIYTS